MRNMWAGEHHTNDARYRRSLNVEQSAVAELFLLLLEYVLDTPAHAATSGWLFSALNNILCIRRERFLNC